MGGRWPAAHSRERKTVIYVLVALDTILGLGVLLLVFLHSGKDAGLSTTFGGCAARSAAAAWSRRTSTGSPSPVSVGFFIVSIALAYRRLRAD